MCPKQYYKKRKVREKGTEKGLIADNQELLKEEDSKTFIKEQVKKDIKRNIKVRYDIVNNKVVNVEKNLAARTNMANVVGLVGLIFAIGGSFVLQNDVWIKVNYLMLESKLTHYLVSELVKYVIIVLIGVGVSMSVGWGLMYGESLLNKNINMSTEEKMNILYFQNYQSNLAFTIGWGVSTYLMIKELSMCNLESSVAWFERSYQYFLVRGMMSICILNCLIVLGKILVQKLSLAYYQTHSMKKLENNLVNREIVKEIKRCVLEKIKDDSSYPEHIIRLIEGFNLEDQGELNEDDIRWYKDYIREKIDISGEINELVYSQKRCTDRLGLVVKSRILGYLFFKIMGKTDNNNGLRSVKITVDDIKEVMKEDIGLLVYEKLDRDENGDVSFDEFVEAINEIYYEKKDIEGSLINNQEMITRLSVLLYILICVFYLYTLISTFDLPYKILSTIWSIVITSGVLATPVLKTFLTSFIFILYEHPYDIGDKILVNGEQLVVNGISLFSTSFVDSHGQKKSIPHEKLQDSAIYNIRRSKLRTQSYELTVSYKIDADKIDQLKRRIREFINNNPRDFYNKDDYFKLDLVNNHIRIIITICHKSSTQNDEYYQKRHELVVKELINNIKIEHIEDDM